MNENFKEAIKEIFYRLRVKEIDSYDSEALILDEFDKVEKQWQKDLEAWELGVDNLKLYVEQLEKREAENKQKLLSILKEEVCSDCRLGENIPETCKEKLCKFHGIAEIVQVKFEQELQQR